MNLKCSLSAIGICVTFGSQATQAVPTLTTLATFNGANGKNPISGLVLDSAGNLYGTAEYGGLNSDGTVYKISSSNNAFTTLAAFNNSSGINPVGGLLLNPSGDLYGTSSTGGSGNYGTVFKIPAATNTLSTLVAFNYSNGAFPYGDLISDSAGNLFGTTTSGSKGVSSGTVFKIAAGTNTPTTLANVVGEITAGVAEDASGNLYGTTVNGGLDEEGSVFKIVAGTNALSTVVTFNVVNGESPSGLIADVSGNLYGVTLQGGSNDHGIVFRIAAGSNALFTLATFNNSNGSNAMGSLILDAAGNLFGTTASGGSSGDGTVFELAAGTSTITTLAAFNGSNGSEPFAGLAADAFGNLYGTTYFGGSSNDGTVFEVTGAGFVVPEPSGLSLAAIAGLGLLRRRGKTNGTTLPFSPIEPPQDSARAGFPSLSS